MVKNYIISLLVIPFTGWSTIRADQNLDDVLALLNGEEQTVEMSELKANLGPASVQEVPLAAVERVNVVSSAAEASADFFALGLKFYHAGELDKAEALFEAVLAKEPYNRRVMEYLRRTARKQSVSEITLQRATRAQAFSEVDAAWNPDTRSVVLPVNETTAPVKSEEEMAIEAMSAHLRSIIIPSLDFRDANITDVVLFLTETCRRQDPSKKGVNILLLGMRNSMTENRNSITISIRNMSLLEALQYIVDMASLKFDIQENAVVIMPVGYVPAGELHLESYDVIPEVGAELKSMANETGAGGIDDLFGDASSVPDTSGPTDVADFFSIVDWPEGSSAIYQPNFHKLFVKNTRKNLKAVEDILADLEDEAIKKRSQQVAIEAKFVEYNEGALEELGFDWTVYGSKINGELALRGSGTRKAYGFNERGKIDTANGRLIYTDPVSGYEVITDPSGRGRPGQSLFGSGQRSNMQAFDKLQSGILNSLGGIPATLTLGGDDFDLAISALEREGSADVLSAPKVTTKSGNEATIRIVEVHRYPQDYDVETGQRTAPVVKPQDWEEYDLGVLLKVTPVVDAESNIIDLDLEPQIRKFVAFDRYVVGYNSYESGGNNASELFGDGTELVALMPYFETRAIQTQVSIADGSTVIMGGLVDERTETFRDQVPILGDIPYLGRLFRTEGSRISKRNLVITVKATQVDDRGMTREQRELNRQTSGN